MSRRPDALMLFAAGFGRRMGALTRDRPKPLVAVAGRPLIDHALALSEGQGIARRVANAHYHAELLAAHLAGNGVALSVEAPEILDTGGGLRAALPLLAPEGQNGQAGPVFTLNTDAVWTGPNPLQTLAAAWSPERMDALLLLIPAAEAMGHGGRGDFAMDPDGRIARGAGLVYTGAQILDTGVLAGMPPGPFSLNPVWDRIAAAGRLWGAVHRGGWCDVGRPEGIALAEAMLAGNRPAIARSGPGQP